MPAYFGGSSTMWGDGSDITGCCQVCSLYVVLHRVWHSWIFLISKFRQMEL